MRLYVRLLLVLLLLLLVPAALLVAAGQLERNQQRLTEQKVMAYAEVLASQFRQQQEWLQERQGLAAQLQDNIQPLPLIANDMTIDGKSRDWGSMVGESRWYGRNELRSLSETQVWTPQSLSLRQLAARDERYAYLLLIVRDDKRVYRRPNYLRIDLNDHVEVVTLSEAGEQRRYLFAPQAEGRVEAQLMPGDPDNWVPKRVDSELRAEWRETDGGYNFELKIPLAFAAAGIGFAVTDMDTLEQQRPLTSIGSTALELRPGFSAPIQPAPLPNAIADTLQTLPVRLWLLDSLGRIVAVGGQPQAAMATHALLDNERQGQEQAPATNLIDRWLVKPLAPWWQRRYRELLNTRWGQKLASPEGWRQSHWPEQQPAKAEHIKLAQQGLLAARWQPGNIDGLWLVSAAVPLASKTANSGGPGAVVVAEQWQSSGQLLLQPATLRILSMALLAAVIALLGCAILAIGLAWRLRRLAKQQARALGGARPVGDELSRLQQSSLQLVEERDASYRVQREQKQRLSRSLQTPLAVIASSLELATGAATAEQPHLKRATKATHELKGLLEVLSAEQRAQQLIDVSEPAFTDITELVRRVAENWRSNNPTTALQLVTPVNDYECFTIAAPLPLAINEMLNYGRRMGGGLRLVLEATGKGFSVVVSAVEFFDNEPPPLSLAATVFAGLGGRLVVPASGDLPISAELPGNYSKATR